VTPLLVGFAICVLAKAIGAADAYLSREDA